MLLWSLPILQACATPVPTVATSSGCLDFARGSYDRLHDTLPTLAWFQTYNDQRDKLCGVGK